MSLNSRKLNSEEQKKLDIEKYEGEIYYSERYYDDEFEYRHVTLPEPLRKYLPNPNRIMQEKEWRGLGVRQSPGWEHYMVHAPEPHVLLFKRERDYQVKYPFGKPQ
ncbi:Cyclin-dependent kinases regulatory subunit [Smittium culicis]|uniref:Cyclin-dependent kinases regulatory subunit n=1 Tax=Smittium culicis TaxID=133412 RepID=A0A1R1Y4C0_9FUNG|nr:Cyclin-dependent kinases regulatory subunit [Smittium culicis]